jgi:hypothetical protein
MRRIISYFKLFLVRRTNMSHNLNDLKIETLDIE